MKLLGFVECSICRLWADIPEGFKETKHFAICPICNNPMFLIRGIEPKEVALREEKKVVASINLHGVKL